MRKPAGKMGVGSWVAQLYNFVHCLFGSLFGGDFFFFYKSDMSDRMREVQHIDMIICLSSAKIPQTL